MTKGASQVFDVSSGLLNAVRTQALEQALKRVDTDSAQDIASLVTIRVWRMMRKNPSRLEGPTELERYVHTATRNALFDRKLKERRRMKRQYTFAMEREERNTIWQRPDGQLTFGNFSDATEDALSRIAPKLREAYRLVAEEGLTHAEAAGQLDVSEAALKSRLRRARTELRRELAPFGDDHIITGDAGGRRKAP